MIRISYKKTKESEPIVLGRIYKEDDNTFRVEKGLSPHYHLRFTLQHAIDDITEELNQCFLENEIVSYQVEIIKE